MNISLWGNTTYKIDIPMDLDTQYYGENRRFLLIEKYTKEIEQKKRDRYSKLLIKKINKVANIIAKKSMEGQAKWVAVAGIAKGRIDDFNNLKKVDDK